MIGESNSLEGYIRCIQHNANRTDIAHHTVLQQGYETATDIILLQEPYCPKINGQYIGLQHPAYDLILPTANTAPSNIPIRPRVLTYIRKARELIYTPRYDLFNDPDIQAVEVMGIEAFLVYNVYNEKERSYNLNASQDPCQGRYTVDRLLLNTQLHQPTLLAGDFNLHHPRWNSAATPANTAVASNLVSWLDSQQATLAIDPEVVNEKGGTYHRSNLRNISIIDLTFYTSFSKLAWSGWRYIGGSGSDHEVIAFEAKPSQLPTANLLFNSRPPLFNYKLADWDKYCRLVSGKEMVISQQIVNLAATNDYDGIAVAVTDAILEAAEAAIPRLKPCERSKPWWNLQLTKLRKSLNSALRRYKKYKSSQLEEEYKEAKNTYFQSVRQAKRTHWDNFLQDAIQNDVFKAYNYTKKACHNSIIPTIEYAKDGRKETAKTFEQKCEAFLTTLFPAPTIASVSNSASSTTNLPTSSPQSQSSNGLGPHGLNSKDTRGKGSKSYDWDWPSLDDKEVKEAIFSFQKTAPGPDTIGSVLIQKTYQAAPGILNSAYKALFEKGYHPISWRSSIGIILPKNGDRDTSDPRSYRVIALLNSLGKVLEKIYATRLSYLANTTELLHSSQLGGRKQRSTIDAAMLLVQYIEEQRLSRKVPSNTITSTIFLDIKGGFDHVAKEKLIGVLERLRLPKTLISWVSSFLTNRSTQLAFSGQIQQQPRDLLIGTPQGSPISPILFLIYIREILADKAFQISYIDDFSLSVSSTSAKKNCKALEKIVARLIKSAEEQGVSFNPKKTELIHFTTQRVPITEGVNVAGEGIAPKASVKWLGIWFDPKLSFKKHIEKRINLAMASFLGMQRLASTQKGLSFRAMRQLYMACITTVADYGVPVWYRGPRQGKLLQLYQRLQNQALPKILGAFGKSPIRAMELEAAILPPEIRFQKACLGYSLRTLYFQQNHPIREAYNRAVRDELADSDSDLGAFSLIKPTTQLYSLLDRLKGIIGPNWNIERQRTTWKAPWAKAPTATITISPGKKEKAKQEHEDLLDTLAFRDCVVFYTDGSQGVVKGQRTSSCAYCEIEDEKPKAAKYWNLGPFVEVADAELIAIAKALETLQNRPRKPNQLEAYIFVDSQAAIQKISGLSDIAAKIRVQLARLANKKISTTIAWCPSHMGIPGNELADKLAKKGLEASPVARPYISLSYLRRRVREECLNKWKEYWAREEEREALGLKARGLGNHYRKVVKDGVRFAYKPNIPAGPRATQAAFIQLKLGIGYLKTYQKVVGNTPDNNCRCGQVQTAAHLLLYCKRYKEERRTMRKALGLGQRLSLQVLFSTTRGREALIGFLASTAICTAKWFGEE